MPRGLPEGSAPPLAPPVGSPSPGPLVADRPDERVLLPDVSAELLHIFDAQEAEVGVAPHASPGGRGCACVSCPPGRIPANRAALCQLAPNCPTKGQAVW